MKSFITALFILCAFCVTAQEETELSERSEIKINALYLILGGFELDYEYMLNEESTIGLSATIFFDDDVEYGWGITPHYRLFFGNQPALGFFVEGHASVFEYNDYTVTYNGSGVDGSGFTITDDVRTMAGVGLSVGGKFKTSRNVVVEVVAGLGRTFNDQSIGAYPRFGINIGKRF